MLPEEGWDPSAFSFGPFTWEETDKDAAGSAAVKITEGELTKGLTLKDVFFRSIRPVAGGRTAVSLNGESVVAYTDDAVAIGFDLHNSNLPMKYDFPVLMQNILNWLLPAGTEAEAETEAPMPLAESDVRVVAPNDEPDQVRTQNEKGRELTSILLALFLVLLVAEMGVSRYVG